jgi:hypothetical protein
MSIYRQLADRKLTEKIKAEEEYENKTNLEKIMVDKGDTRKKYYISRHQNKEKPFAEEMRRAKWVFNDKTPHVALFDRDAYMMYESGKQREPFERVSYFSKNEVPIFIFPHTAIHHWWYDGILDIEPYIRCIFEIGEGQKEVMKIISPETNVEVCGWPWCKQKYFQQPKELNSVLFAPIHPDGSGSIRPECFESNRQIQQELLELGVNVTCRYIGNLEVQGLEKTDKWTWIRTRPNNYYRDIDDADLVIAEGVFMYLSVARGKPTIGINQHLAVRANINPEKYTPHNWDKYGHILAYPINYKEGHLSKLMDLALKEEQLDWRKRLIGNDMEFFAEKIEEML